MNKFSSIPCVFALTIGLAALSSASAATFSAGATADAFVAAGPTGNLANNNYGGGNALAIAAAGSPNGEFQTVIMFDLSTALASFNAQFGPGQWSIQSVSLQLTSSPHGNVIYNNIASGLFGVSLMQNNSWVEGTGNASNPTTDGITFDSLQGAYINNSTDQPLGTFHFPGGNSGANSYSLNLSSGLTADVLDGGNLSLRLFAADNQVSYLFNARSVTPASDGPELIITAVPEPGSLALVGVTLSAMVARRFHRGQHSRRR